MKQFLYDKVATLVSDMISSGALKPGDRVPSLRKMSKQLQVSIATVTQAYVYLEDLGLIESRPASGYYVRHLPRKLPATPQNAKPKGKPRNIHLSNIVDSIYSLCDRRDVVPFGIAQPDHSLLPNNAIARATRQALSHHNRLLNQYAPQQGLEELRRQVAFRSADIASRVDPSEVIITNSGVEAIGIALRSVAKPGDIIAVQTPVYFSILQQIKNCGMLSVEVESDSDTGIKLETLENLINIRDIKAVLVVANFNNPSGSLMTDEQKRRLVKMLNTHNIPLIEDDVLGDLYYGETRPSSCKHFDPDGMVISLGSFSKTLSPGYRLGWLYPGKFYAEALQNKAIASGSCATLTQLALADYLKSGHYDHHLMRLRRALREQSQRLSNAIQAYFPEDTRITRPQGGMALWVQVPQPFDTAALYSEALSRGTSFTPGELFSARPRYDQYMRLCTNGIWNERVEQGVYQLGQALKQQAIKRSPSVNNTTEINQRAQP